MKTLTSYPPNSIAQKPHLLAAPLSVLYSQRSKLRVWAFSAAVRVSDQNRPIILKLLLELAIVIRMLAQLAQDVRGATGEATRPLHTSRAIARASARRSQAARCRTAPGKRASGPSVSRLPGAPYPVRAIRSRCDAGAMRSCPAVPRPSVRARPVPALPPGPVHSRSGCRVPTSHCA